MERDSIVMFRAPESLKQALKRAAQDDARTMSSLALKVLSDWLRDHRYLEARAERASRSRSK
jgi:hypothetical protein